MPRDDRDMLVEFDPATSDGMPLVSLGADELAANPPPFSELQVVLVRALSKPVSVQSAAPA